MRKVIHTALPFAHLQFGLSIENDPMYRVTDLDAEERKSLRELFDKLPHSERNQAMRENFKRLYGV